MRSRHLAAIASIAAVAACAPMEQAPLVYTSKVLVGAHVEAGTPENPGLAINLGIKGLDAAFVPVAVAKFCAAGGDCEHEIYRLSPVAGTSDEAIDPALKDKLDAVATRIGQLQNDSQREQDRLAELTSQVEAHGRAQARLPELRQAAAALRTQRDQAQPEALGEIANRLAEAEKGLAEAEAVKLPPNAAARAQEHRDEIARLATALAAAKAQQAELQLARDVARRDKKGDAFSVYGSFDGSAEGGSDSAGLALGKVFSTGIAAQNLTQGIKDAAIASAKANCLAAVDAAVEAARKAGKQDVADRLYARKPDCLL